MAERGECEEDASEDDICPTQRDVEELKKKLKSPDRAKFERELEKINAEIREHEAKYRSFQSARTQGVSSSHVGKDRETLMTELRGFKVEREDEIDTRKKIDQELKSLNSLVQQKNDSCAKVQAGLKYKTEAKADEAIRRLEHQLRVQQLKLREEKRLVSEIDALKRSKKLIHDFDALKQEIGQLRDKQNALRKQRDNCMRTIARLKSREEEIKSSLDEQRSKDIEAKQQQRGFNTERNALKKEIDDLYGRKRALVSAFNKEKEEYNALLKDIREQERHIKREVEAMKRIEQRHLHRQRHGSENAEDPSRDAVHQTMIGVCDSLITYINGLNVNTKAQDSQSINEHPPDIKGDESSFTGGSFLKKKKDDDLEEMYAGATKRNSRRGSKKGRKSTQRENTPKKLVLHPAVLDKFLSVAIVPPSTAAEIPKVLELLIEKKTNLNSIVDLPDPVPRSPSPTLSSGSSLENFPSLPSFQESASSMNSKAKDKPTNKKGEVDEGNDEVNLNKVQENSQDTKDDTERSTSVVKTQQETNHKENDVGIESAEQESTSDVPKENNYTKEEQISNISENAKQNGPSCKENDSLCNSSEDNIDGNDLESPRSNDDSQNLDAKESNIEEHIENHTNDIEGKLNCNDEEKCGLKEDTHIVIGGDNLTNACNSKANSSIKCPS